MNDYRKYFPAVEKHIYFNNAAISPLNTYACKAAEEFLKDAMYNGGTSFKRWCGTAVRIKEMFAELINAKLEELAIIKNTTSGILFVANGLDFKAGDNVILPAKEFPANVYPWLNLKKKGVDVKFVKFDNGRVLIKDILSAIDKKTRIVSVSHVQFTNGFRIDLEELGAELKRRGVLLCVDAIQSAGVFDIDVKKCNIDFLAVDSHKWLLGVEGAGFFYCTQDKLDMLELQNFGYTSVTNHDDYMNYNNTVRPDAARFQEGSLNMLGIHALHGSLTLIKEVSVTKIRENVLAITDYLADRLTSAGCTVTSPRDELKEKSGIIAFTSPKYDTKELWHKLMSNNIYLALRDNAIRLSPHFYNTEEEADRLIALL